MRITHLIILVVLVLAPLSAASPAQAGSVVTVCDEAHLLAALAGGGTVTFACSGVITLSNTIVIAADTTIDGSGQDVTISGNDAVRVFIVSEEGVSFNLHGLTVANGNSGYNGIGGGIFNGFGGTLTVSNSTFSGNSAHIFGGGIYNYDGTVIVTTTTFSGNDAYRGGGIYNYDGTVIVGTTTFSRNDANRDRGGRIHNGSGTVTVDNSAFSGNSAGTGGGGGIHNSGALTVSNSTFTGNSAYGAAI